MQSINDENENKSENEESEHKSENAETQTNTGVEIHNIVHSFSHNVQNRMRHLLKNKKSTNTKFYALHFFCEMHTKYVFLVFCVFLLVVDTYFHYYLL